MNFVPRLSIRVKLFVPIAAIIVVITTFQVVYFPLVYAERAKAALADKAAALTSLVAGAVEPALEFEDATLAKEVLELAGRDPELVYAVVQTATGATLASYGDTKRIGKAPALDVLGSKTRVGDHLVTVAVQVESAGGATGVVMTGFSLDAIIKENSKNRSTTVMIGGVLLFFGLVVALWAGTYVRRRIDGLERIADDVGTAALQIRATSGQILAGAQQQERGATEQSASIDETRRTLDSLLASSQDIAEMAQGVVRNAESTQKSNEQVAESIGRLVEHTERIGEILDVIRGIANKSELLALNAALEGTKAGEAGRGFSLVANQMQRLAENVMGSVSDIKDLTADIRKATSVTVLSTEEGTKLAADTTTSAKQISMITQQQKSGSDQVSVAMEDIATIAQETAQGSLEAVEAIRALTELSDRFEVLVARFKDEKRG